MACNTNIHLLIRTVVPSPLLQKFDVHTLGVLEKLDTPVYALALVADLRAQCRSVRYCCALSFPAPLRAYASILTGAVYPLILYLSRVYDACVVYGTAVNALSAYLPLTPPFYLAATTVA